MNTRVHSFAKFMQERSKKMNESGMGFDEENKFGANPEDEDGGGMPEADFGAEGEGEEGEEEPPTLEGLAAQIKDLTARVDKLEGKGEGDETFGEEGAEGEGEEGEAAGEEDHEEEAK